MMGICLGASALTLLELVDFLTTAAVLLCKKWGQMSVRPVGAGRAVTHVKPAL